MSLTKLRLAWDSFWFADGSPVPVAIFRILVGLLVVTFCWATWVDLPTFFGDKAIVLPEASRQWMGMHTLNVYSLLPGHDLHLLQILLVVFGVLLTVGLFSRVSAFVVYLLLLTLQGLDCFVLYNIIELMLLMSFYLMFSRCGDALSLARVSRVWLTKREYGPVKPGSAVVQRLIQIQVALLYWSAFASKLHGTSWIDGTAMSYVTHLNMFQQLAFPYPQVFDHLFISQVFSWATLIIEPMLFTLIWIKELRYPVLLLGLLFHAGMELVLCIPLLQLIMVASYVNFIDPEDWSRLMRRVRKWASWL